MSPPVACRSCRPAASVIDGEAMDASAPCSVSSDTPVPTRGNAWESLGTARRRSPSGRARDRASPADRAASLFSIDPRLALSCRPASPSRCSTSGSPSSWWTDAIVSSSAAIVVAACPASRWCMPVGLPRPRPAAVENRWTAPRGCNLDSTCRSASHILRPISLPARGRNDSECTCIPVDSRSNWNRNLSPVTREERSR